MSYGFSSVVPVRSNTYSFAHVLGEEPSTYLVLTGSDASLSVTNNVLIFNNFLYNTNQSQNGSYNTSTGKFTASVGGRFGLGYCIAHNSGGGGGSGNINIRLNNNIWVIQRLSGGSGSFTNSFVFFLKGGESADIYISGSETFNMTISTLYFYDL
jgi:hypothetical protein